MAWPQVEDFELIHEDDLDRIERYAQAGESLGPAWTIRLVKELRVTRELLELLDEDGG